MGKLFIVATPIGNLGDITFRAVETLESVDLIAAEDTRHSQKLLQQYSIRTPLVPYHEHNETQQAKVIIENLRRGQNVALISDAGTPTINDPGYRLVCSALEQQVAVVPIPGCCAAIAALSAAGLPTDRFVFEGFLPNKGAARRKKLEQLKQEPRTLVFYESSHRISAALTDCVEILGAARNMVLAREITKQYETIKKGSLGQILAWVEGDPNQQKGEFVLLLEGQQEAITRGEDVLVVLRPLMASLPLKQAAALASEITGAPRNAVYQLALECRDNPRYSG